MAEFGEGLEVLVKDEITGIGICLGGGGIECLDLLDPLCIFVVLVQEIPYGCRS